MFGVECSSGDTFTDGSSNYSMVRECHCWYSIWILLIAISKTSMFVPEPVISLSIKPKGLETPNFSRALNRFQKEDPTFKVHIDHESKQVGISIFRLITRDLI